MKRASFPVFLFLAGCAGPNSSDVLVRVVTLDPLERTFELAPSAYDNYFDSKDDLKQAMRLRATAVCAPSGVQVLVLDEPEYLKGIDLSPHGYLFCRR